MASGAVFNFELSASGGTPDRIDLWNFVVGDLLLNSNVINLSLLGTVAPSTYNVDIFRFFSDSGATATAHSLLSGLSLAFTDPNISSASIDWDGVANDGKTIAISYTVVPEPSTAVLLGLGVAGLTLLRRRRA